MMADSERGMKLWSEYGTSGYSRSPTKVIKYRGTRSKLLKKPVIMTQLIKNFRWKSKVRCRGHRVRQRLFCEDGGVCVYTHTHTHTHAHTHIHTHAHTRARARGRTHTHTRARARARARPFIISCHLTQRLSPCIFFKCISRTDNFWFLESFSFVCEDFEANEWFLMNKQEQAVPCGTYKRTFPLHIL